MTTQYRVTVTEQSGAVRVEEYVATAAEAEQRATAHESAGYRAHTSQGTRQADGTWTVGA